MTQNLQTALETLVRGFPTGGPDRPGGGKSAEIREYGRRLLVRLCFVRLAEDCGLLPLQDQDYRTRYSLRQIRQEIAGPDVLPAAEGTAYWDRLQDLFCLLGGRKPRGSAFLGLPPHQGGLFQEQPPFGEQEGPGDQTMAQVIRMLYPSGAAAGQSRPEDAALQLVSCYEDLLGHQSARRASGSYYTPHYIVSYMVERTLAPLLEQARTRTMRKRGNSVRDDRALVREILQLKILDPAMGGGLFLIEAAGFLARALAGLSPNGAACSNENSPPSWRRQVAERCLYGLDKDPLAVEVARLSLWLFVGAADLPLHAFDRRLRCGDALIGARLADLREPPFPARGNSADGAPARAHNPPPDQQGLEATSWQMLADLWVSAFLGNHFTADDYGQALALQERPEQLSSLPAVQRSRQLAQRHRFFHWELAFPEVLRGKAPLTLPGGFQAVLGNPPYQFGERISSDSKKFFKHGYALARGQFDSYWLFYERAFELLAPGGIHSHIVPDALLARDEAEALRQILLREGQLLAVAPVGAVFPDPQVSAVITVWQKGRPAQGQIQIWRREGKRLYRTGQYDQELLARAPRQRLWVNLDPAQHALIMGVNRHSIPLDNYVQVSRGEELGKKDLLPIDDLQAGMAAVLVGSDIAPLHVPQPRYCIPLARVKKDIQRYHSPKIVLVKTGRHLVATVDTVGRVTLQSVYNLHPSADSPLSLFFLAALLKSTLLSYFLQATVTGYKQIFPQLNQSTVRELPVCHIAFTTPAEQRSRLLHEGLGLIRPFVEAPAVGPPLSESALGRWLAERLAPQHIPDPARVRQHNHTAPYPDWQLPETGPVAQSDVVHDLLAHLAKRMLFLDHNRSRLRREPDDPAFRGRLFQVHADSLQATQSLQEQIACLGRLIDEAVYRLYGLGEQDIALVDNNLEG